MMLCIGRGLCTLLVLLAIAASPAHAQKKRVAKPAPRKPAAAAAKPGPRAGRPDWIKELSPGMLRDYSGNQPPVIMDTPAGRADDDDNGGKESPKEGPNGKPVRQPARLPAKQTFHSPAPRGADAFVAA